MNLIKIKVGEDTKIFMVKKVTVTLGKTWGIINLYFFSETDSGEGDMLELVVAVDEVGILLDGIGSGSLFDMDECGASIERSTFYTHVSGYIRADKMEELGGKFYDKDMQLYSLDDTNCDFSSMHIQSSDSTTGVDKQPRQNSIFTCLRTHPAGFDNYEDEEAVCDNCCYKDNKQECEGCLFNSKKLDKMNKNLYTREHNYFNGGGGGALANSLYTFGGDIEDTEDTHEEQPEDITEITHSIPDENNHKELSDEELESTILPWSK